MSQLNYKNYHWTYTLVFLKRSHCCLFCPSRACQEAKKAEMVSKCCQNFRTKHFQRNSHNAYLVNAIKSLTASSFQCINLDCVSQVRYYKVPYGVLNVCIVWTLLKTLRSPVLASFAFSCCLHDEFLMDRMNTETAMASVNV